ncbi:hypothetical protein TrCOL_g7577 [Triparma columacea]|uniref:Uncharacterized protein n=1 Tax=Triparma columacea TaxID=722753 RepID=A0A9W7G826_9STRA|nr:hypothetical protein TrCOL_g7577 [Triparma columacea]
MSSQTKCSRTPIDEEDNEAMGLPTTVNCTFQVKVDIVDESVDEGVNEGIVLYLKPGTTKTLKVNCIGSFTSSSSINSSVADPVLKDVLCYARRCGLNEATNGCGGGRRNYDPEVEFSLPCEWNVAGGETEEEATEAQGVRVCEAVGNVVVGEGVSGLACECGYVDEWEPSTEEMGQGLIGGYMQGESQVGGITRYRYDATAVREVEVFTVEEGGDKWVTWGAVGGGVAVVLGAAGLIGWNWWRAKGRVEGAVKGGGGEEGEGGEEDDEGTVMMGEEEDEGEEREEEEEGTAMMEEEEEGGEENEGED